MFDLSYIFSIGGIHIIAAIFFAIHAVRSGQGLYWVFLLFIAPFLGSLVYFFAIYLPQSRIQQNVGKAANVAMNTLDPGKALRQAQKDYELTPTAQNRMQLAKCLLDAGQADAAAEHYEACLQGPFASDPEIQLGAAQARLANQQAQQAVDLLHDIQTQHPKFQTEHVTITLAKAYGALGQASQAQHYFDDSTTRFGSFQAHAEYAIWAADAGQNELAQTQYSQVQEIMKHWKTNRHAKALNKKLSKQLEAAMSRAGLK